jgi:tetratricopeptide (TPR) repeat protein
MKSTLYFLGDKLDDQKRSLVPMIATFLVQIMAQSEFVPLELIRALEGSQRHGRSRFSESDGPETLLVKITSSMPSPEIVLDGLDEFHDVTRMLGLLQRLSFCNNLSHIVVLSRDYPIIRHALGSALHVDLVQSPVRQDIQAYIRFSVEDSFIEDPDTRENVICSLIDRADNSFLWAALILNDVITATSFSHIEQIMAELPKGLEMVYAEIFHKLSLKGTHSLALSQKTFLWVCCSWRPLNWAELQCALANAISGEPHSSKHLPFKPSVLDACGGLVRHEAEQDILRPVHLSVREYLTGCKAEIAVNIPYGFQEPDAHGELAKQCLEYLGRVSLPIGKWDSTEFPMLSYATHFWCRHAISSSYNIQLHEAIVSFLSDSDKRRFWLMNMVFWSMTSFPIRGLVRMQTQLNEWTNQSDSLSTADLTDAGLDWTVDIMHLLLHMSLWQEMSYFVKAMHMRDLARSLTLNGQLSKAVTKIEMELFRPNEERENTRETWLLNFLGVLYDQQGKVEHSLQTQQRSLEMQELSFGITHPKTVWTVNEMGRVFRHLGRLEESEKMHLRALETISTLENNDMEIAWTKSTLSRTYRNQGRFRDALDLSKEAFNINANLYGEEHPQCLWILNDIGQCYRFQTMYDQAERSFRQAWERRTTVLGAEHSDTLWSANNLGIILEEMGRHEEAMDIQTRTLEVQERVLGPQHQFTAWTRKVVERLAICGSSRA